MHHVGIDRVRNRWAQATSAGGCRGTECLGTDVHPNPERNLIMINGKTGVAIATAAAALFSLGTLATSVQAADDAGVKCSGANSCKGHSECKTAKNECKGQNTCKGQGWVMKKNEA